jgi:hypothetical protein
MEVLVQGSKRDIQSRTTLHGIFRSLVTFVAIDEHGASTPVPPVQICQNSAAMNALIAARQERFEAMATRSLPPTTTLSVVACMPSLPPPPFQSWHAYHPSRRSLSSGLHTAAVADAVYGRPC